MNLRRLAVLTLAVLPLATSVDAAAIVADHTRTDISGLSNATVASAAALRVHLRRASVGGNISSGLDTLHTQNSRYDRSKWVFGDRGNPGWQAKVDEFVTFVNASQSSYDVLSMKFCFIDPDATFSYYRDAMLGREAAYPTKKFVWWTIPIETSGNADRQSFNDQVRAYATANSKILFDIADIESHNALGQKLTDGDGLELMRDEWTDDGGHLASDGATRVASAWWWLMTQIATPPPPTFAVTAISPVSGPITGGTAVTVTGAAFVSGATLSIGGVAASGVTVTNATTIIGTTGAHASGLADVTVTLPDTRSATLPAAFFYASPSSSTQFYGVSPCRLVDTRATSALSANERRVLTVVGSCAIPAGAKAVALNLTVAAPGAAGFLRLSPGNGLTGTSALNFSKGQVRANSSVVQLATDGAGTIAVTNVSSGATHVILDASGYFQ